MAKLLIVDSDSEVSAAVRDMMRLKGHEVAVARTAAEALAVLAQQQVDVIFTNIDPVDQHGRPFAAAARALQPLAALVTTKASAAQGGVPDGFDTALPKPFSLDEVEAVITLLQAKHTWRHG